MDDTLYPENAFVMSGFKAVSKFVASEFGVGRDIFFSFLKTSFDKNGRGSNFNDAIDEFGLDTNILPAMVQVYRRHSPDIHVRQDIKRFLLHLSQRFKLCLITDGWVDVQKEKVKALGLEQLFHKILFSQKDGLEYAKPHPRFFEDALDYFGMLPEHAIIIGDDVNKDIAGGKNIGMKTFQVFDLLSISEQEQILKILDAT